MIRNSVKTRFFVRKNTLNYEHNITYCRFEFNRILNPERKVMSRKHGMAILILNASV